MGYIIAVTANTIIAILTADKKTMKTIKNIRYWWVTLLLLQTTLSSQSFGNVLFLIMPGHSRWLTNTNVVRELKNYGYNSTFVLPKGKDKLAADAGVEMIVSEGMTKFEDIVDKMSEVVTEGGFRGDSMRFSIMKEIAMYCPLVAGDNKLMETLSNKHFDVMIADTALVGVCMGVIAYKLSLPFIQIGRAFQVHNMRALIHPAAYPTAFIFPMTDRMTYSQRFANTMLYILFLVMPDLVNPADIVGTFAPDLPHITNEQLKARTALYLLDIDELIDYHLPTYPNVKYVGGVVTRPANPLTGDLKVFLDSAVDGAVLVSFGSVVACSSIPNAVLKRVFGVFQRHAQLKFIFKYGNETKIDDNVMLMPWIPQNDVLAHPNIKLFISHCGNNGQFEALFHGVPMIGLPVFAEQPYNAARIQVKGFGIYLNIVDFTIDDLDAAISELLSNSMYKQNIMKASKIFKSRYFTPAKRAAWWIDHVITFGSQHLHSAVADLPYYQFLMIDVWAGLLASLILVCFISYLILRCVWRTLCKHKVKTD